MQRGRWKRKPDKTTRIRVVYRPVEELVLDPRNPRRHSAKQVGQIARSIEAFGFNVPILIGEDRKVIAGHGRVLACRQLGLREIPTVSLEHLSEAQARAFMIADNRLTENSQWDDRLLAEQLKDLSLQNLDFDLEATGFEIGEIDVRIESLEGEADDEEAPLESLPSGPPVTRPGDLWQLGRHRVHCGSALDPNAYAALLGGEQANVVFSDPPYNVRIEGNVSGLGKTRHREFAMASGEMSEGEFVSFLDRALQLHARHSVPGSLHYICMDWRHLEELLCAGKRVYSELKNMCVWAKDNGGMGSLYRSQHELIFVFKYGREAHRNNVQLGKYGRNRSNVWHYPCANSFSRTGTEGNQLALHPTAKPVALVADAIVDCTSRDEVVLDGFLGSGTTIIAAERSGRRCFGIEIDPLYVDTIVRRWERRTGAQAVQASTGKLFNELAADTEGRRG